MKEIIVTEFSSFDGNISDAIQYQLDNNMIWNKPYRIIGIQSITLGTHHIINGAYPTFPYTLAIVVFEGEREEIKDGK